MFSRGISRQDVYHVLRTGEVIETYREDTPYPSMLLLGWSGTRPLHVVVANDVENDTLIVVTSYEPDDSRWEPAFRRRA